MNGNWANHYALWRIADLEESAARAGSGRTASPGTEPRPAWNRRCWQFGKRLFTVRRRRQEGRLVSAQQSVPWPRGAQTKSVAGNQ